MNVWNFRNLKAQNSTNVLWRVISFQAEKDTNQIFYLSVSIHPPEHSNKTTLTRLSGTQSLITNRVTSKLLSKTWETQTSQKIHKNKERNQSMATSKISQEFTIAFLWCSTPEEWSRAKIQLHVSFKRKATSFPEIMCIPVAAVFHHSA